MLSRKNMVFYDVSLTFLELGGSHFRDPLFGALFGSFFGRLLDLFLEEFLVRYRNLRQFLTCVARTHRILRGLSHVFLSEF